MIGGSFEPSGGFIDLAGGADTGERRRSQDQVDPQAKFNLRSRGIPETQARGMLVRAFAHELIERIGAGSFKDQIMTLVDSRFGDGLEKAGQ